MRLTYALYLEMPVAARLPGFWEGIAGYGFCRDLDQANFRIREEIARIEFEGVTEGNRACGQQVVERAAQQMLLPALRRLLDAPELTADIAAQIAEISIHEVESAPNPTSTHGLGGAHPSVLCPRCQAPMVRRPGRGGKPFWGCSKCPDCTGTRQIST